MAAMIGERVIEGDGTAEATWQAWPGMESVADLILDRWLPATARLVVVAPHPDDEVLACGGLLSTHAARGGATLVVAVTDGEASHTGSRQWGAKRLGPVRQAESEEGLMHLGLRAAAVARLGLPDGAVQEHVDLLTARIEHLLSPVDRVVSTWRYDGHPDHEATGRATAAACSACRSLHAEAPVWMWHWAIPGDVRVPWHRLRRCAVSEAVQARKERALKAHATQLRPRGNGQGPVLGEGMLQRLARRHEYLFV